MVAYLGDVSERRRLSIEQAARGASGCWQSRLFDEDGKPEWVEVDSKRVRVEGVRDFGGCWLGLEISERLGLTPLLETERLVLRPFQMSDAPRARELAGAYEIYKPTLNIPHPYEDGMAEKWIARHASQFYEGRGVNLAITLKANGLLIGAIGLGVSPEHQRAALGYWIGVPYWGNGYCTEAAVALIKYGFDVMKLHKITSSHMEWNTASGRVMQKAGMRREGALADHVMKDGRYHTMMVYGIVNSEQTRACHGADTASDP